MKTPTVNAPLQAPAGAPVATGRAAGRAAGPDRNGPAPAWAAALAGLVGRLELLPAAGVPVPAAAPLAAGPMDTGAAAGSPVTGAVECPVAVAAIGRGGLDAVAEHIAARAAAADPGRVAIRFGSGRLAGVSCQVQVERGRVRCRLRAGGAPCREALRSLRGRLALRLADRGLELDDFGVES